MVPIPPKPPSWDRGPGSNSQFTATKRLEQEETEKWAFRPRPAATVNQQGGLLAGTTHGEKALLDTYLAEGLRFS